MTTINTQSSGALSDGEAMTALERLLRYERWATDEMRGVLSAIPAETEGSDAIPRARMLFAHVIGAHRVWLGRIERATPDTAGTPGEDDGAAGLADTDAHVRSENALEQAWPSFASLDPNEAMDDVLARWTRILETRQTRDVVQYETSEGDVYANTVGEIAVHVLLHSSYHRGQIAMLLGSGDGPTAVTDFIHATRNGLV